jgi:hypothetical protein
MTTIILLRSKFLIVNYHVELVVHAQDTMEMIHNQ